MVSWERRAVRQEDLVCASRKRYREPLFSRGSVLTNWRISGNIWVGSAVLAVAADSVTHLEAGRSEWIAAIWRELVGLCLEERGLCGAVSSSTRAVSGSHWINS